MNITLTPETQKLLEERLRTGEYRNADDLLHTALEMLARLSSLGLDDATLDVIDRAEDQIDRGQVHEWKAVRDDVRREFLGS